jgi:hypothetical protein
MSRYAWIITKDCLCQPGDTDETGTIGPRGATDDQMAKLRNGEGKAFRMYDDDGEHYYNGRIIGQFDGLEPLEDFGTPNAGATEIRMIGKSGKWETI